MLKYDKFKLSKVLQWQSQKEIDPLKIKDLTVESNKLYPFYGQATVNNGIISYLSLKEDVLNNKEGKPTILIHSNNQNIVFLETPFYLKDGHGATSVLQSECLNEKNAMFLMACIKKVITKKFTYNGKATKIALKNTFIDLPVDDNGAIDYDYMEQYISKLEEDRINKLSTYLKVSALENCALTKEENEAVNMFRDGKVKFKRFKIGIGDDRIFNVSSSKKKFNANTVKFDGQYPYVARSSTNNGIRGYINENPIYLNNGGTISFGQDTATIFYQEKPYFTGDKIKIMTYRGRDLTPELACYLLSTMRKAFQNFAWGQTSFNENILNNVEIELPVNKNESIDNDFIINFIKAQEKLAIKGVVEWKNKILSTQ